MAYADGTGRTPGILNGLGVASAPDSGALPANYAGSPKPDSNRPGNNVVDTAPNNQAPQVHPSAPKDVMAKALGVVRAVAQGHIPGVVIPTDAPKFKSNLTPQHLLKIGAGIYRPVDKSIAGVLYHPKTVPLSTLQALDKAGKLSSAFPPITKFLGLGSKGAGKPSGKGKSGVGTPGADTSAPGTAGPAGTSTGTPQTGAGAGQEGRNTPSISDLNLTGTPTPTANTVPVLPRPGFGAGANEMIARKRVAALGAQPVFQQSNPASSIVSGLTRAPV